MILHQILSSNILGNVRQTFQRILGVRGFEKGLKCILFHRIIYSRLLCESGFQINLSIHYY